MTKPLTAIAAAALLAAAAGIAFAQTPPGQQAAPATTAAPADANVCAKLAEADCGSKEGCSWLPGFKVPGGADVPGYCRPSPRSVNARRPKE